MPAQFKHSNAHLRLKVFVKIAKEVPDMNKMIPVYEAASVIQRDAVLSHLKNLGIESYGAQRDVSRRYADSSVDLSYEGYSVLMGGFTIFAESETAMQAKAAIQDYLKSLDTHHTPPRMNTYLERFYSASLFSVAFPFFPPVALYYMVRGLLAGEEKKPFLFWFSIVITLGSAAVWTAIGFSALTR
jgi:hypothetical protein